MSENISKTVRLRKSKTCMYHYRTEFVIPYKKDKNESEWMKKEY